MVVSGTKDISKTFDRVVVVNLARRPERMERFRAHLGPWPFNPPERFEAIDGEAAGVPPGWDKGPGAWGCMLSHRRILEQALADGIESILVLEDDAYPVGNFAFMAVEFLRRVPQDWDGLMLGAEHLRQPLAVQPGIVRCIASNRTHAYAVRGRFMQVLLQFWQNTVNDHCDIVLSSLMRHFKVYAPNPLLIGQDAGESDVTARREPLRFLNGVQKSNIALRDPRHLLQMLVGGQAPANPV